MPLPRIGFCDTALCFQVYYYTGQLKVKNHPDHHILCYYLS